MKRMNPAWIAAREEEIIDRRATGKHINVVQADNLAVQWLVARLAQADIPYRVIQLGAGVKRVTTDVNVCPKCNGTGKC